MLFRLRRLTVNYRLYNPPDFPALYAIEEACFTPPVRFQRSYLRQLVRRTNGVTWIAEEHGQLAGFATAGWNRQRRQLIAYIETIEVLPIFRGRGAGSALLRSIEASAQAAEATLLWLHVDAENTAAIRLYEAHAYLRAGREEDYYPDGHSALVYLKRLVPPA